MKILLIGDAHLKIHDYKSILNKAMNRHDRSYQLGDFGYYNQYNWWKQQNFRNAWILKGNHDYPYNHPNVIQKHFEHDLGPKAKVFGIAGAYSTDQLRLVEGRTWWRDEELSYAEADKALEDYKRFKPDVMLSHDCPNYVRQLLFGIKDSSITSQLLQSCFEAYQPPIWIFGHHHRSKSVQIEDTKFVCLAELEALVYEL